MRIPFRILGGSAVVASVGSLLLTVLATQHHTMHMLILALGSGAAGMSFMTDYPLVRRSMLLVSLVMAGLMLVRLRHETGLHRLLTGLSIVVTLGVVVWSFVALGF